MRRKQHRDVSNGEKMERQRFVWSETESEIPGEVFGVTKKADGNVCTCRECDAEEKYYTI